MPAEPTALERGCGIADGAADESAADWVRRMRKRKKPAAAAAAAAEAAAAQFDELDDAAAAADDGAAALAGMRVEHGVDSLMRLSGTVLTLKDQPILDSTGRNLTDRPDVLESGELLSEERRAFRKRARAGHYDKYDEDADAQGILPQYNEAARDFEASRRSFALDGDGGMDAGRAEREDAERSAAAAALAGKTHYSLGGDTFTLQLRQRDTFTQEEEEEAVQIRRPKRRKLVRKKQNPAEQVRELERGLGAGEAEGGAGDAGAAARRVAEREQRDALARLESRERREEERERARQSTRAAISGIAEKTLTLLKEAPVGAEDGWQLRDDSAAGRRKRAETLIIDPTAEFARTIETDEAMLERRRLRKQEMEERKREADERERQKKEWVDMSIEEAVAREDGVEERADQDQSPRNQLAAGDVIEEPNVQRSMAESIKYLRMKGLFDRTHVGRSNDKVLEFDDTNDPAPNIVLDRKDEKGRPMTQKEAFRQQSHRFHGKSSSRHKTLQREKRWAELQRQVRMGDTDTGLRTLTGLRAAQESTQQAGIVLQGGLMEKAAQEARDSVIHGGYAGGIGTPLGSTVSATPVRGR